jgi:sugar lactone lactonase YvrE
VASGALTDGSTVIVNSDGTVSVISETSATQTLGTRVAFENDQISYNGITYDSNAQKVVVAYRDGGNSGHGTAVVGTVSGTSISFGTPVVFESANSNFVKTTYDSNAQKIVIAYQDAGNSSYGTAIVGTVSGTSISFGTPVVFNTNGSTRDIDVTYDSSAQKTVIVYRDEGNSGYGTAIVGTVSSTSISFGSAVVFESARSYMYLNAIVYDSNAQKVVIVYNDSGNSQYGTTIVGTVSGTSISFGSPVVFYQDALAYSAIAYDSNSQKVVIAYRADGNSYYGEAIVGTVSGTSISFGSSSVFESAETNFISIGYDPNAQKIIISYRDEVNSTYGTLVVGTVSGTSISFDTPVVYENGAVVYSSVVYDPNNQKIVISYQVGSDYGKAFVFQAAYTSTNLTSENFLGFAAHTYADTQSALVNSTCTVADIPQSGFGVSNASYDSVSFSVNSQTTSPYGLAFSSDGTKMYMLSGGLGTVFQYSLSTAFDLSTSSYDSVSLDASSQDSAMAGVAFNTDGTKMYLVGYNGDAVYQYSLSTGFDLSTASYDSVSFSVSSQLSIPFSVTFNTDGTKMYVSGFSTDTVFQYSLSTGFNLSTASYDSVSFDTSSQESSLYGLAFNTDGTKMYVCGDGSSSVHQYSLSTGFDLSAVSYDNVSFDVSSQDATPRELTFNTDGTKMYVMGDANNTVFQYTTLSGLTAGQTYYVQTDGSLGTTAGSPSVVAGTAISSTEIIVKG